MRANFSGAMRWTSRWALAMALLTGAAGMAFCRAQAQAPAQAQTKATAAETAAIPHPSALLGAGGTVERVKVHGKSLEGNLEGDSPELRRWAQRVAPLGCARDMPPFDCAPFLRQGKWGKRPA